MHESVKNADVLDVVSNYVTLKKNGSEYVGLCPFHDEKSPSFSVNKAKQIIKCFGCGWSGDAAKFIMDIEKTSFRSALQKLTSTEHINRPESQANIPDLMLTVPDSAPQPDFYIPKFGGLPVATYRFANQVNQTLGYTARYRDENGKKQIIPFTYRIDGKWYAKGFGAKWPAYGLQNFKNAGAVVITEGEKSCDAVQLEIPESCSVSWSGGAENVMRTDWSAIISAKKTVLLVPDNDYTHTYNASHPRAGQVMDVWDQPGIAAMLKLYRLFSDAGLDVRWVAPPGKLQPCGWDVADRVWSVGELGRYLAANISAPPLPAVSVPVRASAAVAAPGLNRTVRPYIALGFKKDGDTPKYCFLSSGSQVVINLSAAGMTESNLMNLAPLNYWEDQFPSRTGRARFDDKAAAQHLMNECIQRGIFTEELIRGRGGWIDKNRTVIHAGNKLIVDGSEHSLSGFESKYIYEQGLPLDFTVDSPLTTETSAKLIELMSMLSWTRKVNAQLLAGWCVIAPVCGALSWRPHIWITGAAGTGKSWVFQFIVRPLLGQAVIAVQGKTTEPGIRNLLRYDAIPVVFDEAEGEDQASQQRIQSVLTLMRGASVSDGGNVAQAAAGGGANIFKIRSCFAFASIGVRMDQQADRSRITLLEMKKVINEKIREEQFKKISLFHNDLITPEFVAGLHARTIRLLPIIVKNIEVFNRAAVTVLKEKRHGDQLGALLAGAYSLVSESEVSYEAALEFVSNQDWSEEHTLDSNRDEYRLFNHIVEQFLEVENDSGYRLKLQVGELIEIARGHVGGVLSQGTAETHLRRNGIKTENQDGKDYVLISNSHDSVKRILKNTAWAGGNHGKILTRIDGSRVMSSVRFGIGVSKSNAVAVPLSLLQ